VRYRGLNNVIANTESIAYKVAAKLAEMHKNGATKQEIQNAFGEENTEHKFKFWEQIAIGDTFQVLIRS
jgi:predicted trehalose synthase